MILVSSVELAQIALIETATEPPILDTVIPDKIDELRIGPTEDVEGLRLGLQEAVNKINELIKGYTVVSNAVTGITTPGAVFPVVADQFLLEDGTVLLLEDGAILLLEST